VSATEPTRVFYSMDSVEVEMGLLQAPQLETKSIFVYWPKIMFGLGCTKLIVEKPCLLLCLGEEVQRMYNFLPLRTK